MSGMRNGYVIEKVPTRYGGDGKTWYCHMRGYSYVPVFGSIGSRQKAESVCKVMNLDGKVRRA